jgi:TetR/AcrR family transcriptional regulator, ethionamide resistance regulator
MTGKATSRRSRPAAARKGDLREQEILNAAEALLATRGYVHMTVGDISTAAGVTRSALYFYFASKEDVLIALVARTVRTLQEGSVAALDGSGAADDVFAAALDRTAQQWRDHGVVMRAAVDFGSTVPDVDRLWTATAHAISDAIAALLIRSGTPDGDGPDDAPALARAVCWMVERSFYQASKVSSAEVAATRASCLAVWRRLTR